MDPAATPFLLDAALAALHAGLSIVPPTEDGAKKPLATWKQYQATPPTERQVANWYAHPRTGLGVVCGAVSGSLECLDFDDADAYDAFVAAATAVGLLPLVERIEAGYSERTPSKGVHWLYRCSEIGGNSKLARRPKRPDEQRDSHDKIKTLIETRGESGYVIVAPSHGAVHASRRPYELVQGGFSTIVTITPNERASLHTLARSFDQVERSVVKDPTPRPRRQGGLRPGDDFGARTSWEEILSPDGWTAVHTRESHTLWRRPGKSEGWSASTNFAGSDLFYCWSTSTDFEAERGYSKFAVYTVLKHGGNFAAAAKALAAEGYGEPATRPVAEASLAGMPGIIISDRPLRDISRDALRALVAANAPPSVFVRHGALVRVRSNEVGRPFIEFLTDNSVRGRLTRVANFLKRQEIGVGFIETHESPPVDVVRDLLSLGDWPELPPLEGLTEAPVLRLDGTVLDAPGYDPATHLVYRPRPGFRVKPIPAYPSAAEIAHARALVLEAICDFPFADAASYTNALALLFTPLVRTAFDGPVPLALLDKPRAGTGASLLADLVAIIATGRDASMAVAPRNEDEWRKRLIALLLDGTQIAVLDNIGDRLTSDVLASALTAGEVTDRILGKSEMVHVANKATWIGTGNNLGIGGDLPRRCYVIRLDARTARPWEREGFAHDPLKPWVRERRSDLLAALLTLGRSWFAAGRPATPVRPLGSFEAWSQLMGSLLAFLGFHEFLANLPAFYIRADDDARQWEGFLGAWHACFGEGVISAVHVATTLRTENPAGQELREVLPEDLAEALENDKVKTASFVKRLGKALAKRDGTQYGDYRLERAGEDGHAKTVLWRVRDVQGLPGLRGFAGFSQPRAYEGHSDACVDGAPHDTSCTVTEDGLTTNPPKPANPASTESAVAPDVRMRI